VPGVPLTADRVIALDEMGITMNLTKNYVLTRKGAKHTHRITSSDRTNTTVVAAASLDGYSIPPFYIFKGKRKPKGSVVWSFLLRACVRY